MSLYGEPDTAEAPADGTLVVPDYAAAPAGSSGPTSMGSEPQSSAARQPGSIIPFEKLGRRAEVIGPAYLCCIVGLGIMAALVIAFEPDTTVDPESQLDSFSDGFWFVWVTFHSCTYGDIVPKTDAGRAIAAACSGTGYLFFIFVCLTTFIASQQPSGTPAVVLRSSAIQGVFKFMPAYGCVVIGLIILGAFFDASDAVEYEPTEEGDVDMPTLEGVFFAWNTFHHASYGDRYPVTTLGCITAGLLQVCGFMFPPYALACALTGGGAGAAPA
jgi:hypothetical protein